MIKFIYKNDTKPYTDLVISPEDDCNLTQLFATFVEYTRMIGYLPHSWINVINQVDINSLSDDYSIYDWALDNLIE